MAKNTIKLLDVVALTVNIPEYNFWRGQVGGLWLNCWLMVQRLKLNLAIVTDALMNLSGCIQSKSWCCTLSQHHRIANPKWLQHKRHNNLLALV